MTDETLDWDDFVSAVRSGRFGKGNRVLIRYDSYIADTDELTERKGTLSKVMQDLPEDPDRRRVLVKFDTDRSESHPHRDNDWRIYHTGFMAMSHKAFSHGTASKNLGKAKEVEVLDGQ